MPIATLCNRALRFTKRLVMGVALLAACCPASIALADWKDDIGYPELVAGLTRLGIPIPNGGGVPIALVEALQVSGGTRSYKPDPLYFDFDAAGDPTLTAVTFIDGSKNNCGAAPCSGFSTHARGQARVIFGNSLSIAPAANTVTLYEANDYLSKILHAPSGGVPAAQDFRVQNFSWIGTLDSTSEDILALRRFDFLIDRDNITAVVGINNNTNPLPPLLGQSYNSIAVGRTDGVHSNGLTNLTNYGPGRSKPDIVAPQSTVSVATSSVSSVATFLHSAVAGTDAAKSEVMKAILLAGATKNEFPTWSRSTTQPLDVTYGAGEVNVFNSYLMTMGGRYWGSNVPSSAVGSHGWDYQSISPGEENELHYSFIVPEGSTAPELSIALTWNVEVPNHFSSQSLANLDLKFTDSLGEIVDQSVSTIDNVEHIYLQGLTAGDYTLTISTDAPRDFGLAWRMSTLFDVPSADFDGDGQVTGRDFLAWQRGFGKLLGATHTEGDADGDGDVDYDDLLYFQSQYLPTVMPEAMAAIFAVPEPGTALLISSGVLVFLLRRRGG